MTDGLRRAEKEDDLRVNVHKSHEINYWARQLRTSPERIKKAIDTVGPMVKDMKKWLSLNSLKAS